MDAKKRIIVAIDVDSFERADPLVKELAPYVGMFKAGSELITAEGGKYVMEFFRSHGVEDVFLDLKYHDTLTTTGRAAAVASKLGVAAFNVHLSSGMKTLHAARAHTRGPKLWGVTLPTSHDATSCGLIYGASPPVTVLKHAHWAALARFDGIICSPEELVMLRQQEELKPLDFITPGIRPEWAPYDDHKRLATPFQAIRDGATYLVIGRPVTNPPDGWTRTEAIIRVLNEADEALKHA